MVGCRSSYLRMKAITILLSADRQSYASFGIALRYSLRYISEASALEQVATIRVLGL